MVQENQRMYHGVIARYRKKDTGQFAILGFVPFIIGALGMATSSISYFGWTLDLGIIQLTEGQVMIPVLLIISMLFFAGGIEWYVLCRHCPCYEHSGKEHSNEKRFYCLANWASPKLFKYAPGKISVGAKLVFLFFAIFYIISPVLYLWDRWPLVILQAILTVSFLMILRHVWCATCPNFGCVLNCVPEENREKFLESLKSGQIYGPE
ncbi:MAG: hypothetical protein ACTSV2_16490 [Candidatus Thorarchaeota archaeon]